MDLGIAGKRALVAASSAGLGLATAKALVGEGCEVVISGRDPDRLAAAVAEISDLGTVHGIRADVATEEGARALVDRAREAMGDIDILVANAGGPPTGRARDLETGDLDAAVKLNLQSAVVLCGAVVDGMVDRGWGRIVAITSKSVRQPMPNMVLSNTVRAGVTAYLKTLSAELAPHGVTVNTVQPGSHRTERLLEIAGGNEDAAAAAVPVGHLGDPDAFGQVTAFLCSEPARHITGAAIAVDGGETTGLQ